jgi:hypothetical protein
MSARPLLLIMPAATDQSSSLLWLKSIATDFVKNRNLEHIDLFNILHNVIANLEQIDIFNDWELIDIVVGELLHSILQNTTQY